MSDLEDWRPVADWEGLYEVSDKGRVRGLERVMKTKQGQRKYQAKLFTPGRSGNGYLVVSLSNESAGRKVKAHIHSLVAQAFIGPQRRGLDVNHIDGNKHNNRIENLEYTTRSRNIKHAVEIGLRRVLRGVETGQAKLDEDKVRQIRKRLSEGVVQRAIAREFGVSRGPIDSINRGLTWKHVK